MSVKRDVVTDLCLLFVDPRIDSVGQYLALEIGVDVFRQRYVLGIAQRRIRLRSAFLFAFSAKYYFTLVITQRTLHRDGAKAECLIREDAGEGRELYFS